MAKPTLALIPSAIGDKLYSVLPSDGGGDFDLTRATTATRVNSQGLIETVASGDVRLDYPLVNGVVSGCPHHLIEPSRTNYVPYSDDFINSAWSKLSAGTGSTPIVTPNYSISPSGELDATRIQFDKGTGTGMTNYSFLAEFLTVTSGMDASKSIYLKSNTDSEYDLVLYGTSDASGTNVKKIRVTSEWQRFDVFKTITSTSTGVAFGLREISVSGLSNTADILAWGAQVENGLQPTSYIPTNESTVTRDADVGVPFNTGIKTGDISSYVNGSNGVFYFEGSFSDFNVVNRISLSNSTGGFGGDYISISTNDSGSTEEDRKTKIIVFYKIETPSSTGTEDVTVNDVRDNFKMAISWDGATMKGYINGVEFFSNSETAFGGFDRIYFSRADNNISGVFHGKQKDLRVYDTALTDAELVTLTTL